MVVHPTQRVKRYIPIICLAILMVTALLLGAGEYLSLETIKENRQFLIEIVGKYPLLAPVAYIAIYIIVTALSIPGALFLSLTGGFLFPQPLSTLYTVVGASIGASILFLVAKTAMGKLLRNSAMPFLNKMEKGIKKNGASYLLFLRFIPIFPFWLVNLAPALFSVPFFTFAWTTVVGITPGAFVFTQAGAGLGAILDADAPFSIEGIFNTEVKIALIALGLFALLPTIIRKMIKGKRADD